jgi:hypothetical protein
MEANLDEEYYKQYLEYKQKYLMLKQLKNNNDLEGGMFGWLRGKKKIEEPETEDTDGTYLVFWISETQYEKNFDEIKFFSHEYHNDFKIKSKDGIEFIDKKFFEDIFNENAYIVTKYGPTYTYSIITKDIKNEKGPYYDQEYEEMDSLIKTLEEFDASCDCKKTNSLIFDKEPESIILKKYYKEIMETFNKNINDYNDRETQKEAAIKTQIDDLKEKIKAELLTSNMKKYKTNTLEFTDEIFDVTKRDEFLNKLQTASQSTNKMNMIIKIKDDNDAKYKFDGDNYDQRVTNTEMYARITKQIFNNKYSKNLNKGDPEVKEAAEKAAEPVATEKAESPEPPQSPQPQQPQQPPQPSYLETSRELASFHPESYRRPLNGQNFDHYPQDERGYMRPTYDDRMPYDNRGYMRPTYDEGMPYDNRARDMRPTYGERMPYDIRARDMRPRY